MPVWSGAAGVSVTSVRSGLVWIVIAAAGAAQSARVQTIWRLEASSGATGLVNPSVMKAPETPKLAASGAGGGAGSVAGVSVGAMLSSAVWIWLTRARLPAWSFAQT